MRARLDPPSFSDSYIGWHDEVTGMVFDSREYSRAAAQRRTAEEQGYDFKDIRTSTRYACWHTLQEQWEEQGRDRWTDEWIDERPLHYGDGKWRKIGTDEIVDVPEAPEQVPDGWEPDEYVSSWYYVPRGTEGAVRIYLCEWE